MTFDEFLDGRLADLVRFAVVLCGQGSTGEQLVADAVSHVYEQRVAIEDADAAFARLRVWIVRGYLSEGMRLGAGPATDVDSPIVDASQTDEDWDDLTARFVTSSKLQRTLAALRYYSGLEVAEIASVMGSTREGIAFYRERVLHDLNVHADDGRGVAASSEANTEDDVRTLLELYGGDVDPDVSGLAGSLRDLLPDGEAEEAERVEAERAEAERLEADRVEAERLEVEHGEAERLATVHAEAKRLAVERVEAERTQVEQLEVERLEVEQTGDGADEPASDDTGRRADSAKRGPGKKSTTRRSSSYRDLDLVPIGSLFDSDEDTDTDTDTDTATPRVRGGRRAKKAAKKAALGSEAPGSEKSTGTAKAAARKVPTARIPLERSPAKRASADGSKTEKMPTAKAPTQKASAKQTLAGKKPPTKRAQTGEAPAKGTGQKSSAAKQPASASRSAGTGSRAAALRANLGSPTKSRRTRLLLITVVVVVVVLVIVLITALAARGDDNGVKGQGVGGATAVARSDATRVSSPVVSPLLGTNSSSATTRAPGRRPSTPASTSSPPAAR